MAGPVVYRSLMSDNLRWYALELRPGDIVIVGPPKCGLTWTQRLVSLLVFGGPELPGPLSTVSPWLDQTLRPIEQVVATLDAQPHRRFIKTHTPLDGLVLDDRVTYIGVGRDPRDAAMSQLSQEANVNPDRMRAIHDDRRESWMAHPDRFARPEHPDPNLHRPPDPVEVLRGWMAGPAKPSEDTQLNRQAGVGSLAHILHNFNTLWQQRHRPNVAVFHYSDYQRDLVGELLRMAHVLGYQLDRGRAEQLASHATLDAMRARAADLAPNAPDGFWQSNERFFRAGGRGEWRALLPEADQRQYAQRAAQLSPPDVLAWAHDGRAGCDPAAPESAYAAQPADQA